MRIRNPRLMRRRPRMTSPPPSPASPSARTRRKPARGDEHCCRERLEASARGPRSRVPVAAAPEAAPSTPDAAARVVAAHLARILARAEVQADQMETTDKARRSRPRPGAACRRAGRSLKTEAVRDRSRGRVGARLSRNRRSAVRASSSTIPKSTIRAAIRPNCSPKSSEGISRPQRCARRS